MNLNQLQQEPTAQTKGTKAQTGATIKEQVKEQQQENINELLEVLNNSTTESAFWDRNRPLENCDVVGCVVKRFVFEGKEQTFDNGDPKWEFLLKLIEPNGMEKYVSCVK